MKTERILSPGNPGNGTVISLTLDGKAQRADLHAMLAEALQEQGVEVTNDDGWLHQPETGYAFMVQIADINGLAAQIVDENAGRIKTTTTIEIFHPALFPHGCFEYQHSFADDWRDALREGLASWVAMDWPALRDAAGAAEESACSYMHMDFSGEYAHGSKVRAVFGPCWHYRSEAPPQAEQDEEHDFCPCCLFTQTLNLAADDYLPLLQGGRNYAIRYFASRDEEGDTSADCRINGEDWAAGRAALQAYAAGWPACGFELRKQYVVLVKEATDSGAPE